jgi:hypothetical protein
MPCFILSDSLLILAIQLLLLALFRRGKSRAGQKNTEYHQPGKTPFAHRFPSMLAA